MCVTFLWVCVCVCALSRVICTSAACCEVVRVGLCKSALCTVRLPLLTAADCERLWGCHGSKVLACCAGMLLFPPLLPARRPALLTSRTILLCAFDWGVGNFSRSVPVMELRVAAVLFASLKGFSLLMCNHRMNAASLCSRGKLN